MFLHHFTLFIRKVNVVSMNTKTLRKEFKKFLSDLLVSKEHIKLIMLVFDYLLKKVKSCSSDVDYSLEHLDSDNLTVEDLHEELCDKFNLNSEFDFSEYEIVSPNIHSSFHKEHLLKALDVMFERLEN